MQLSSDLFARARSKPFGEVLKTSDSSDGGTAYVVGNANFFSWATHWLKYTLSKGYRARVRQRREEIADVLQRSTNLSVNTAKHWEIRNVIGNRKGFLRIAENMAATTETEHFYRFQTAAVEGAEGNVGTGTGSQASLDGAKAQFVDKFVQRLKENNRLASQLSARGKDLESSEVSQYINSLFDKYLDRENNCITVSQLRFASDSPGAERPGMDLIDAEFISYVSTEGEGQRGRSGQL